MKNILKLSGFAATIILASCSSSTSDEDAMKDSMMQPPTIQPTYPDSSMNMNNESNMNGAGNMNQSESPEGSTMTPAGSSSGTKPATTTKSTMSKGSKTSNEVMMDEEAVRIQKEKTENQTKINAATGKKEVITK